MHCLTGSALGRGCGPLIISKDKIDDPQRSLSDIKDCHTRKIYHRQFFAWIYTRPRPTNKVELLFSDIEDAVLNGDVDAGLIIHENRFTHAQKGLLKVADLGDFWETQTQSPIPLGGIVVNRKLPVSLQLQIDDIIKRSVEFAFKNPEASKEYVKQHAQAMNEEVMYKHIALYVNEYSVNLGTEGRKAQRSSTRQKHCI